MKTTMKSVLYVLLMAMTLGTAISCSDYQDDIDATNARIEEIKKKDFAEMKKNIGDLQNTLSTVQGNLTTLEGKVSGLQGDMTQTKTDIADMKTNIQNLQNKLADLVKKSDYDAFVKAANKALGDLQTLVNGLRTDLTTLQGTVSGHGTAIEEIKNTIQTLTGTTLPDLQGKINGLTSRISKLEGKVDNLLKMPQSIVFVSEYTDGQIGVYSDNSHFDVTYAVTPADLVGPLMEAYRKNKLEASAVISTLKTRAPEISDEAIEVIDMQSYAEGTITVTYRPKEDIDLSEFYGGTKNLSLALKLQILDAEGNSELDYITGFTQLKPLGLAYTDGLDFIYEDGTPLPKSIFFRGGGKGIYLSKDGTKVSVAAIDTETFELSSENDSIILDGGSGGDSSEKYAVITSNGTPGITTITIRYSGTHGAITQRYRVNFSQ